ncbi:MAG: methionyl-tRNA formyltransferase [Vulcanimicrobiota bacterium]
MKLVFFGSNGRLSTRPLEALAQAHQLAAVVEGYFVAPAPRLRRWLAGNPQSGNLARFSRHHQARHLTVQSDLRGLRELLEQVKPEALCLANFPFRLPSWVFSSRPALNLHPSLLPRYRGIYPWLWQFYHQEPEGGFTVHLLDEGLDTGPILAQQTFPIPFGVTASELFDQVLDIGSRLLVDCLANPLQPQPQRGEPSRAPLVHPHQRLIDWHAWPVERVYHFLRGASLWHDELSQAPGFRWRAVDWTRDPAPPGRKGRDAKGFYVGCRGGRVLLQPVVAPREAAGLGLLAAAGAALIQGLWP